MPDYSKGKIYRIVCNETGEQYIGSTTQTLAQRLSHHVSHKNCMSSKIIYRGNYEIILIEECPCENKNQLLRKERHFIETLDCINIMKPAQTNDERLGKLREYYKNNKETQLKQSKECYKINRVKKIEYQQKYTSDNKDDIKKTQKEYYDNNREKILEKKREYYAKKKLEKKQS
jgi:hypothetical protein